MEKNDTLPARLGTALLLLRIASAVAFLYHGSAILFRRNLANAAYAYNVVQRLTERMTHAKTDAREIEEKLTQLKIPTGAARGL